MCYGANNIDVARHGAVYVDRILKGTKPADLPVEQPLVFDLSVNASTMRTMGLTIPPSVSPLVTEWIN
jgi:putative ABC transport system substrate-binding protein